VSFYYYKNSHIAGFCVFSSLKFCLRGFKEAENRYI
jgi:hypothetical protein